MPVVWSHNALILVFPESSRNSPFSISIPESITATSTPFPVTPPYWVSSAFATLTQASDLAAYNSKYNALGFSINIISGSVASASILSIVVLTIQYPHRSCVNSAFV